MKFILFSLFLLVSLSILKAGELKENKEKIIISKSFCEKLLKSTNKANHKFGADYVPNKDVYGREVVSANASSSYGEKIIKSLEVVEIPINVDLAKKYGLDEKKGLDMKIYNLADITIKKDGTYYINEKIINKKDKQKFIKACEEIKD